VVRFYHNNNNNNNNNNNSKRYSKKTAKIFQKATDAEANDARINQSSLLCYFRAISF